MENLSIFHSYSNKVLEEARSVSGQGGRTRGNIHRPDHPGDFSFSAKICDRYTKDNNNFLLKRMVKLS